MDVNVSTIKDVKDTPILVAVPNDWLQIPIIDLLSTQRETFFLCRSLPDLYQKIKEYPQCIIIMDIFAFEDDYRVIVKQLISESFGVTLILLVSKDMFSYVQEIGDIKAYIVNKEKVDIGLSSTIIRARKDRLISQVIAKLIEKQKQLLTLTKEVKQMEKENGKFFGKSFGRRTFLKGSAAATVVATGVAMSNPGSTVIKALATENADVGATSKEEVFPLSCRSNCFQSCMLNAHARDGKLVKTSMRPYPEDDYSGCCLKGLSIVQRTYSPTRLKQPLRRVGERGNDQWETISWDEAIAEIGQKFVETQKKYGDQSLVVDTASGCYGLIHGVQGIINRFSHAVGATRINVCYDQALGYGTNRVIGGGVWLMGNEPADMLRSKVIFIWGSNPVYTQPQSWRIIAKAQRNGAKVICIDPIKSATAHKSDEYIPIVPGTDLLLTMCMMRIIIEKDWLDYDYLKNKSTAPYLVRRDNGKLLRKSDFTPVSDPKEDDYYVWDQATQSAVLSKEMTDPALEGTYTVNEIEVDTSFTLLKERVMETDIGYTSEKTGISVEKIHELTKLYTFSGASSIYTNYGIDHYQNGHLWGVCIALMGAMTGNIARPGCSVGGLYVNSSITFNFAEMYVGASTGKQQIANIPQTFIGEVFRDQKLSGKPFPLKAMLTASSNPVSNFAEQNQWFEHIIPNLDFWVVLDTELTDTARYADIVLPVAFWAEVNDLRSSYNNPFLSISNKAIEPLYDCKSDLDIINLIAHAMGLQEYFPLKSDTEWIKVLLDYDIVRAHGITYERLQEEVSIRTATFDGQPFVRGVKGWPTATGKVEIYCENPVPRTDYGQDLSEVWEKERLPYFKPPNEAWSENPLFKDYPLVYLQEHSRFRTHSQWYNVPMLKELDPEPLAKLSRKDADDRGIKNGDKVEVYNHRGKVVLRAIIDDSINTGILIIPKGWQRDQFEAGCYQELTNTSSDPMAVNFAYYDTLVNVRKL